MAQAPFYEILKHSYRTNYDIRDGDPVEPVYVTISFLKRNAQPALHLALFADFLPDDQRYLILLAPRNGRIIGDLKASNAAEVQWTMQKSCEMWHFYGKLYSVASPTVFHRYSPPRIYKNVEPKWYWEMERRRQWTRLSAGLRATFSWPMEGGRPRAEASAFLTTHLPSRFTCSSNPETASSSTPSSPKHARFSASASTLNSTTITVTNASIAATVGVTGVSAPETEPAIPDDDKSNANLIRQMAFHYDRGDSPVRNGIPLPGERKKTNGAPTGTSSPTSAVPNMEGLSISGGGQPVAMHPVPVPQKENGASSTATVSSNLAASPIPVHSHTLDLIVTGSNVHDGAFDNFCLLVFRCHKVEHLEYSRRPYTRMAYEIDSDKDTVWRIEELNP